MWQRGWACDIGGGMWWELVHVAEGRGEVMWQGVQPVAGAEGM